jgi:hypothetical protein
LIRLLRLYTDSNLRRRPHHGSCDCDTMPSHLTIWRPFAVHVTSSIILVKHTACRVEYPALIGDSDRQAFANAYVHATIMHSKRIRLTDHFPGRWIERRYQFERERVQYPSVYVYSWVSSPVTASVLFDPTYAG